MAKPLYFDYAATTPLDPAVIAAMQSCLGIEGDFGNPSSLHYYGAAAANRIELARQQIADCINAEPREIVFTSGATEANNLAIKGLALAYQAKGKHIITCQTEHKSVLEPCRYLETLGFEVTYLPVLSNGLIDSEQLKAAIRMDTILISIMQVNNEIGVIQGLAAMADLAHQHNIVFHSDAAQSIGKLQIDVKALGVDALSLSAHKAYGPKGIGILYINRPKIQITPQLHGGGHEYQLRPGTLPTHQIVGMAEACLLAEQGFSEEFARISDLKAKMWRGLQQLPTISLNGSLEHAVPHILNVSFSGINAEIVNGIMQAKLAVASGAACDSNHPEPSHVLIALGISSPLIESSIRFSMGRYTTESDINHALEWISTQF
ncbi:MAG: aminotransferase class V-fold PLP-dependent enzyme [Gammaproteobacteria bacterium]|nr:aminotransferase class V-fold PLP-dependent enzyme [Gammaproteobacteria bacterium]